MRKIITIGISLFIILTFLVACNQGSTSITLDNMKNTLKNTGYTIDENYAEFYKSQEDRIHSIRGFSFIFPGENGNVNTPVLEFQDNASAESYAELVNYTGYYLAIVNDKFLTIVRADNGVADDNEKIFFEKLINGKSIK